VASLRPAVAAAAATITVALLAGGCAAIPTVGRPEPVKAATGQAQPIVQPIPPVPGTSWTEQDIVQGFLAASASSVGNYAAARKFLAPQLRASWKPSSAVTVVSAQSKLLVSDIGPAHLAGQSTQIATVSVTGHQLATLSKIGQYIDNPGPQHYPFKLAKFGDQWLIIDLPPSSSLLLTQADFEEVYQPRNLYFWSAASHALVPEPVFAPQQDTYTDVATSLVNALLLTDQAQVSWLGAATTTEFPPGTALLGGGVTITGSSATVNLGGAAAAASPQKLRSMAAQLVSTLTGSSYSQPPISRSVVLEINGQARVIDGQQVQLPGPYQSLVPGSVASPAATPVPLYFLSASDTVTELISGSQVRVRGPAGHEQLPFTTIAVSPGSQPQLAGAGASGRGCALYYGALDSPEALARRLLPDPASGPCTSLGWDSLGDIWAVAGQNIWVLPPGARQPVSVSPPPLPGSQPVSYRVLSLRVAPDGVRAAMLIQIHGGGRELVLTAISHSGAAVSFGPTVIVGASVTSPAALSWYDADHLIVLAGTQLYEVPANGGTAMAVGPVPPGTTSVTSAGPDQIATAGPGGIVTSPGSDQAQPSAIKGTSPAYPG
jgi:hypothetical protein